ncbi:MAG: hypothetical protein QOC95_686 [Thermoleophilaceae bacterium]|nr:hypothetical protein [Thermoleophilaceae bacterium]
MRLKHTTTLATLAAVAVAGTAFAATTSDEVTAQMGGSARIAPGGKLRLVLTHKSGAKQFHVTIHYDVTARARTQLAFAVYPCKSTSCIGRSAGQTTLTAARVWHVTFNGHVPVNSSGGKACVYAQIRDLGPKGKQPGSIIHHGGKKGVSFCRKA